MNLSIIQQELCVALTGVLILLLDLWTPTAHKAKLGWLGIAALALILLGGLGPVPDIEPGDQVVAVGSNTPLQVRFTQPQTGLLFCVDTAGQEVIVPASDAARAGFNGSITQDELAGYFKALFLLAAIFVLFLGVGFAKRFRSGVGEFFALTCFALVGMMFAASAASFIMLFVAIELITITFYVLTSFQRHRMRSLEAGVKYLILGAAASAMMVYGIALIYGATGSMSFNALTTGAIGDHHAQIFNLGLLLLLAGLGFKIAAFPFQIWAPDVYQGAPAPVTAFLAIGSKAAGVVLLMRIVHASASAHEALLWPLLPWLAATTIAYGSLCAIRQRNLKRLIGYAGIASAGYLLLGIVALRGGYGMDGYQAILYYLAGYLFAIIAAFVVISRVTRDSDDEDISVLAGLHRRSPLMASVLTLAIVSLAGIPPLAGFLGKFLLLKPVIAAAGQGSAYTALIIVALVGVVVSLYYYFGIIREIFWSTGLRPDDHPEELPAIDLDWPTRLSLLTCAIMLIALGIFPEPLLHWAKEATSVFR
jgi:NADH-quinone oxidoreductase subunit N